MIPAGRINPVAAKVASFYPAANLPGDGPGHQNNYQKILPATNSYGGSAYTLATYSGALTGAFSIINNLPTGYILDYGTGTNGSIRLTLPPPGSKIWSGNVLRVIRAVVGK